MARDLHQATDPPTLEGVAKEIEQAATGIAMLDPEGKRWPIFEHILLTIANAIKQEDADG